MSYGTRIKELKNNEEQLFYFLENLENKMNEINSKLDKLLN